MSIAQIGIYLLWVMLVPLASYGAATWTVSDTPNSSADFASIDAALGSDAVLAGDILELAPTETTYGDVTLTKAVHLRGLLDNSGSSREPRIGELTVRLEAKDLGTALSIESLTLEGIVVESADVSITNCRIGPLTGSGAHRLKVVNNWFLLTSGDAILLNACEEVLFQGNLFLSPEGSAAFFSDQATDLAFIHNTVVDESGTSEWVIYKGSLFNNILSPPMGRIAVFNVDAKGNLSTRLTYATSRNQDNISTEDLFSVSNETIERYFPNLFGPAIGGGYDSEDVGFSGGDFPFAIDLIPGSGSAVSMPPLPVMEAPEPQIGGVSLSWSNLEAVDYYELQLSTSDRPFETVGFFGSTSPGTILDELEEGVTVEVRLRSIRGGLKSDWVRTGPIVTLYAPPNAPEIDNIEAVIGAVNLSWSSPEAIEFFELQVAKGDGPFGESAFFDSNNSGTSIEDLDEGIAIRVRLRTVRHELVSNWVEAGPVTTLYSAPTEPVITETEGGVGSIVVYWQSTEFVDTFELQISVAGGPFEDSVVYPADTFSAQLDNLEEGVDVQIRLRSVRHEIASSWILSETITTLVGYDPLSFYIDLLGTGTEQYDAWFLSPWFGWFGDFEEGLILHLEHGYLYLVGNPSSIYAYDLALNMWIWTSRSYYPNLYLYQNPAEWYLYYKGTASPTRYYYKYSTGEILREDQL